MDELENLRAFKEHVNTVLGDALADLRIARDSSKGSMPEQVAALLRASAPAGEEPEELEDHPALYVVFNKTGEHIRWWSRGKPSEGTLAGFVAAGDDVHVLYKRQSHPSAPSSPEKV